MANFGNYLQALYTMLPAFSGTLCVALLALSTDDSHRAWEKKLKKITAAYLGMSGLAWLLTFCYGYAPAIFVTFSVVFFLTFVLVPIFFYRIVRHFTRPGERDVGFSRWHWLVPGTIAAAMLVWSLFVPFDAQLEIIAGRTLVWPEGYEAYGRFFSSKPLFRALFGLVYSTLAVVELVRYYRRACEPSSLVRRPARWVVFLVVLSLLSLFMSIIVLIFPRDTVMTTPMVFVIITQHILLTYHIVKRKYLLFRVHEPSGPEYKPDPAPTRKERRRHTGTLSRKRLESYFREQKPWLDPHFRITDLVEALDVNRTFISAFINREYGMNFNRWMHRWRFEEYERLSADPKNSGESLSMLMKLAGFCDRDHYNRARAVEKAHADKESTASKSKKRKEGGQ